MLIRKRTEGSMAVYALLSIWICVIISISIRPERTREEALGGEDIEMLDIGCVCRLPRKMAMEEFLTLTGDTLNVWDIRYFSRRIASAEDTGRVYRSGEGKGKSADLYSGGQNAR